MCEDLKRVQGFVNVHSDVRKTDVCTIKKHEIGIKGIDCMYGSCVHKFISATDTHAIFTAQGRV